MTVESIGELINVIYKKIEHDIGSIAHKRTLDIAQCVAIMQRYNTCNTSQIARFIVSSKSFKLRERYIAGVFNSNLIEPTNIMTKLFHTLVPQNTNTFYVTMHNFTIRKNLKCLMLSIKNDFGICPLFWKIKEKDIPISNNDQIKLIRTLYTLLPNNKKCMIFSKKEHTFIDSIIDYCKRRFSFIVELNDSMMLSYNGWIGKTETLIYGSQKIFFNTQILKNNIIVPNIYINVFIITNHDNSFTFLATSTNINEHDIKKYFENSIQSTELLSFFAKNGYLIQKTQLKTPKRIERLILFANLSILCLYYKK